METKLQELKICLDWAEKQLKEAYGSKISNPEGYKKVEELISALNEAMVEEIYKFSKSYLNLNKSEPTDNSIAVNKAIEIYYHLYCSEKDNIDTLKEEYIRDEYRLSKMSQNIYSIVEIIKK